MAKNPQLSRLRIVLTWQPIGLLPEWTASRTFKDPRRTIQQQTLQRCLRKGLWTLTPKPRPLACLHLRISVRHISPTRQNEGEQRMKRTLSSRFDPRWRPRSVSRLFARYSGLLPMPSNTRYANDQAGFAKIICIQRKLPNGSSSSRT